VLILPRVIACLRAADLKFIRVNGRAHGGGSGGHGSTAEWAGDLHCAVCMTRLSVTHFRSWHYQGAIYGAGHRIVACSEGLR